MIHSMIYFLPKLVITVRIFLSTVVGSNKKLIGISTMLTNHLKYISLSIFVITIGSMSTFSSFEDQMPYVHSFFSLYAINLNKPNCTKSTPDEFILLHRVINQFFSDTFALFYDPRSFLKCHLI